LGFHQGTRALPGEKNSERKTNFPYPTFLETLSEERPVSGRYNSFENEDLLLKRRKKDTGRRGGQKRWKRSRRDFSEQERRPTTNQGEEELENTHEEDEKEKGSGGTLRETNAAEGKKNKKKKGNKWVAGTGKKWDVGGKGIHLIESEGSKRGGVHRKTWKKNATIE